MHYLYCRKKPIKNCITYIAQNAHKSEISSSTSVKRQRSRSSLSETTPSLQSIFKKQRVSSSSSEDDVYAYSSPGSIANQTQFGIGSSSSGTKNDSEIDSEISSATTQPAPNTQKESNVTVPDPCPAALSSSSTSSDDSQTAGQ